MAELNKQLNVGVNQLTMVKKVRSTDGVRTDFLWTYVHETGVVVGYVATCVHGGRDGGLFLDSTSERLTAKNLRAKVAEFYGVEIPETSPLYITPCHPASIKRHRGDALYKQNIHVLGDHWGSTYFGATETRLQLAYRKNNTRR